jgi:hypothetical protein
MPNLNHREVIEPHSDIPRGLNGRIVRIKIDGVQSLADGLGELF